MRSAAGRILERRVGVPQAVAEPVHASAIVCLQQLAAFVQVGNVGQRFVAEAVAAHHGGAGLRVQGTVEALGERELLLITERLFAEHQHGVLIHAGTDLLERVAIAQLAQVDRTRFGDEMRMQRAEGESHGA